MCRGSDHSSGRRIDDDDASLKIKAIYVRLLFSSSTDHHHASSESLTLHFPPRINGGPLEIDGSSVRSDTPAFLTLHRVVVTSDDEAEAAAVYGARERMRVTEGSRFEIYGSDDVRVLKGIFRKDEDNWNWRLDCKASVSGEETHLPLLEADVWVETEGFAAEVVAEKVKIAHERKRRRTTRNSRLMRGYSLEEIPEQREWEYSDQMEGGCCCCCECDDGGKAIAAVHDGECEVDVEVEGVRWAVDVGIWVACLGVGYLVSKASRRNRIIKSIPIALF